MTERRTQKLTAWCHRSTDCPTYCNGPGFTQGEAHNEPQKPINTRGLWSALWWLKTNRIQTGRTRQCGRKRRRQSFVLSFYLLVTNFSRNYFSFRPSFILFKSKPLCLSLLLYLPPSFHGYLSLRSVHYLSLPPLPFSLSVSLTLFLSFSFCFHLCLSSSCFIPHPPRSAFYLSPLSSVFHLSLPFKPAIPSCCFSSPFLPMDEESFIGFPVNSAFLIISTTTIQPTILLFQCRAAFCPGQNVCVCACVCVCVFNEKRTGAQRLESLAILKNS